MRLGLGNQVAISMRGGNNLAGVENDHNRCNWCGLTGPHALRGPHMANGPRRKPLLPRNAIGSRWTNLPLPRNANGPRWKNLPKTGKSRVYNVGLFDSEFFGIESDSWFWNRWDSIPHCCFRFFFVFFRSKEPKLAMNAAYKGRRKHPSHNMKIYNKKTDNTFL